MKISAMMIWIWNLASAYEIHLEVKDVTLARRLSKEIMY
jgi:hypothetical protein